MTRNLKWYLAFSLLWSAMFFIALHWGLVDPRGRGLYIAVAGVTYGIGFALLGFLLGRGDDQRAARYGLGYAYAAVANLTSAAIGTLWIAFFRPTALWGTAVYITIMAAFAALGLLQARRSIKGMSKETLFR